MNRRTFVAMLTSACAVPAVVMFPMVFDPASYVADMRAAGLKVYLLGDGACFDATECGGFGDDYFDTCQKWSAARKRCPDRNQQVIQYLKSEAA